MDELVESVPSFARGEWDGRVDGESGEEGEKDGSYGEAQGEVV